MWIYRGARKYAVTMGNLEISTGNQNLAGNHLVTQKKRILITLRPKERAMNGISA